MKENDAMAVPTSSPESSTSRWRADFPVPWDEEHQVSRRQFTTLLLTLSGVLFLGTLFVSLREWWRRGRTAVLAPLRVAKTAEIQVGGVQLFHYPTADDPCLLIRVSQDRFVAYSQKCTHLLCPVVYQMEEQQLYCPCHAGRFAVE